MHELGVVFHVIDQIEELAEENNVTHVNSVTLQIGTVTGIIPDYLIDCWNWAVSKHDNKYIDEEDNEQNDNIIKDKAEKPEKINNCHGSPQE